MPTEEVCWFCGKPLSKDEHSEIVKAFGNTNCTVHICKDCITKLELIYESEDD